MNVGYYYCILDIGVVYEKGKKSGKYWKIGEKKLLKDEILFWQSLLAFISLEEKGVECSEKLFQGLSDLCKKYKLPNYERILGMKDQLVNDTCAFERKQEEERNIYNLMDCILKDTRNALQDNRGKELVYRMLTVLHNLPKAMYGCNRLNEQQHPISYKDALNYAQGCMDDEMKEKYRDLIL